MSSKKPPSGEGTKTLSVHLKADIIDDFRLVAQLQGKTAPNLMADLVSGYVSEHRPEDALKKALDKRLSKLSK